MLRAMTKRQQGLEELHDKAKECDYENAVFIGTKDDGTADIFLEGNPQDIEEMFVSALITFHEQYGIPMEEILGAVHYDAAYANSMIEREKGNKGLFDI